MAGKVTSHDVARRAGVSRATVSFVMNRSNAVTIGEETRRRVLAAAEELGYRPNSAARMLKSGATRTIGLIIADAGISRFDGLIPILFWSIGRSARAAGYDLLLESPDPAETGNPYTALVESRRIDGLLVQGPRSNDTALFELIESDFPTVIIGTAGHPGQYAVNIAGRSSLQEAVSRLIGLGHRRFGYVAFSGPGYVATERRIHAIRETLAGAGLELPDTAIRHGDFSAESGYLAGLALLDAMPDRTAILAGNDTIALGLLSALAERGLSVPGDVSVVGFDDLPFAGFLKPPLSTIRVDADWQGQAAADLLLGRLGHGDPAERRLVRPAPLIWRASAGPPPK